VTISERAIRTGIEQARWPGRFEVIHRGERQIILDGAHSPASAQALADAIHEMEAAPATVVLGVLGDKDAVVIGKTLTPIASEFIVVSPRSPRAAAAEVVAGSLGDLGPAITVAPNVATGLQRAIADPRGKGTVVVTGSLTTVAEAREALGLAVADPTLGV
jgi:dihydrofolate synthase/folylpolyglutamate synthase